MSIYLRVLYAALLLTFAAHAADTNVQVLEKLTKYFADLAVDTEDFDEVSNGLEVTAYDQKLFSEILNDFAWQVDTENYLKGADTGLVSIVCATCTGLFGGISYYLSSLPEWPRCIKYICAEGSRLAYADGYRCIKSGIDSICWETISKTHKLYGKQLLEYAYYTVGCAPNLPHELIDVPTKIPVETLLVVNWDFCENWIRPSLLMPSVAAGAFAATALAVGISRIGYDFYLKKALKKLAKKNYEIDDSRQLILSASNEYPKYKNLIAFIVKYLVDRNENTHKRWEQKSDAHKECSCFFPNKSKQV